MQFHPSAWSPYLLGSSYMGVNSPETGMLHELCSKVHVSNLEFPEGLLPGTPNRRPVSRSTFSTGLAGKPPWCKILWQCFQGRSDNVWLCSGLHMPKGASNSALVPPAEVSRVESEPGITEMFG